MIEINRSIYVFTTSYVLNESSPILYISHDEDGDWQFLGGEIDLNEKDARVISLGEIIDIDQSLLLIIDLPIGYKAVRESLEDNWTIIKG